jgi:2-C-methyl-D-erythritol 4-phosphate cytidylyltransferase
MGGARKAFLELAGEPVLVHALRPFLADERVVSVAVALSAEDAARPPAWLVALDARIRVVAGGATRTESVRRALEALPEDLDVIAVHDAARPMVGRDVVERCIDLAARGEGAVAGHAAVDTIKIVDEELRVVETPERSRLWHAHTPQAFPAELVRAAYAAAGEDGTDDASLVERAGGRVRMVADGTSNLKVTLPEDLPLAESLLAARAREGR